MKTLVLATNNSHKIREISAMLDGLPLRILSKRNFPDFPEVEETGSTLEENAALKARAIFGYCGHPSLADDSGLEVAALGGEPGVNSARYAGPGCTFADNNRKLLRALAGVPGEQRTAVFRCVIAVCFSPDDLATVEGRVEGIITTEERGTAGFGYDPVFFYPPLGKTFAGLDPAEKNRVSHRALALAKTRELLRQHIVA